MEEVTKKVIEELISEKEEPCISVYMPTRAAASVEVKQMSIQLKNLLSSVKKDLLDKRYLQYPGSRDIDVLLKPATDLLGDMAFWQNQKEGLYFKFCFHISLNKSVRSFGHKYVNVMPLIPRFCSITYIMCWLWVEIKIGYSVEQVPYRTVGNRKHRKVKVISQNTGSEVFPVTLPAQECRYCFMGRVAPKRRFINLLQTDWPGFE